MAAPPCAVAGTAHGAPCGPGERRGCEPATSAQRPRAQADRGTSGHGQRPNGRTGGPLHRPTGGRGGVGTNGEPGMRPCRGQETTAVRPPVPREAASPDPKSGRGHAGAAVGAPGRPLACGRHHPAAPLSIARASACMHARRPSRRHASSARARD
jgi:hypothetical protein